VASRNLIYNNQSYNNARAGNRGPGIGIYTGDANKVYNNLIWGNHGGISVSLGATNSEIYNNTVYNNINTYTDNINGIDIESASGTILRNNISYNNSPGNYLNIGTNTTQDHNLFGTNPLFVSTVSTDPNYLKIQQGSLARNAGTNTGDIATLVTTDYWGTRDRRKASTTSAPTSTR